METVKFTHMKDGDREDYAFLNAHEMEYAAGTADRLLNAMVDLDKSMSGYKITRLGHSLQAATRAWKDGADIDWVVCALLHDIGDIYAPYNHDEYAATILRPFVASNAPGWCRPMAISRWSITRSMSAAIPTSGMPSRAIPISMIAPNSAKNGTRTVSIPTTKPSRWNFSLHYGARGLSRGRLMRLM